MIDESSSGLSGTNKKVHANRFGGAWTEDKLNRLAEYLKCFTVALKNQPFKLAYIDAFAGSGSRLGRKTQSDPRQNTLPGMSVEESRDFFDGSVRVALKNSPPFHHFVFVESDQDRCKRLREIIEIEFPDVHRSKKAQILSQEANVAIQNLLKTRAKNYRAVMFLDPYGMQVSWKTMEVIAESKIIDVMILFPLGVAVNRLLRKDGRIREAEKGRLNECFGSPAWEAAFYTASPQAELFAERQPLIKTTNLENIGRYYNDRLKSIFAEVAPNPVYLRNTKNNPLYLLCLLLQTPGVRQLQ
jgi:three-Cys-motif partner protein